MMRAKIMLRTTQAAEVSGEEGYPVSDYLTLTPGHPRKWYAHLRPEGAALGWINGTLPIGGNRYHDTGNENGVLEWSVTAEPGLVPGKLQIAWWPPGADLAIDEPARIDSYDLGPGMWDTGPPFIDSYDGTTEPTPEGPAYGEMRARFIPVNLLYLLD